MSKKALKVIVAMVIVGLSMFIGTKIGEYNKEKWYKNYLPVVEGRGQQEAIDAVFYMIRQYPEILTEDGRTIAKRVDYENDPYSYKIVWMKNKNGRIIIDRADDWYEIPE